MSPGSSTESYPAFARIGLRENPGKNLNQPHQCICEGIADIYGHHALSCARSKGRIPRLNDIIKRSLTSCGIPSLLEPPGISRADGKRPDGLILIPWSRGKSLIWDSTCVDIQTPSHLPNTSRRAASAAELAVKKKVNKYTHLLDNYIFVPFAVETSVLGVMTLKPVLHRPRLPIPTPPEDITLTEVIQSVPDVQTELQNDPDFVEYDTINGPHFLTQENLNDLVRDLGLSKSKAELLASRLKGWKLLQVTPK
ncbi:hypothetical protein ANN_04906 [Periplaneta americana]|uniref:Uncharacterized protein n=1 Tax=Periplaneta americana TaxID=6978 RepID=A0ABQ8TBD0_PERAM|nr:hypothetical protein ANN_04906 [Periplaneta americana]